MNPYKINFVNRTIEVKSGFLKRAEKPGSYECKVLMDLMEQYPGFKIVAQQAQTSSTKQTHKGLMIEKMGKIIDVVKPELREAFEEQKQYIYPIVKQWFLSNIPDYKIYSIGKEELEDDKANADAPKVA